MVVSGLEGLSGSGTLDLDLTIMFRAAAERVMLQYLSDRMYDEVRGQGLTYGVSLSLSITEGRSTLSLTR